MGRNLNEPRLKYQGVFPIDGAPPRGLLLLDELFARTAITVSEAARVMGSSHTTAQRIVDRLAGMGVLREVTNRKRDCIYLAHEIVRIAE